MARFELKTTPNWRVFIAMKGSITLDGVSLTVNTSMTSFFFGADHSGIRSA